VTDAVEFKLLKLEQNSKVGSPRSKLGRHVRSVWVGRYLVPHRPTGEGVQLLRVPHGARDLSRVPCD
jgi:plasmid stabilization system protein ParE